MDPYKCPFCGWKAKVCDYIGYLTLCRHVASKHLPRCNEGIKEWLKCWCGTSLYVTQSTGVFHNHVQRNGGLHKHFFNHLLGVSDER